MAWWAALLLAAGICGNAAAAETPVPAGGHRIVDISHVLKPSEVGLLADKLKALEDISTAQVAILIVPSAGDEGIAPYANRVFTAWALGRKGVDNGVLIVLATGERKVRIEVGRGLEGDIPDVIAKRITAEIMAPQLKAGNYADAFVAGVDAIAGRINHVDDQAAKPRPVTVTNAPIPSSDISGGDKALWVIGFIGAGFLGVILIGYLLSRRSAPFVASRDTIRAGGGDSSWSSSSSASSESSSSSSNDSSGGGGDSAGGGSDSSY